ncbi:MAG: hypothetical protein ACOX5J_00185 [Candidatus Hydrogenedentales bacterium]|jgi:hypothetical protein
MERPIVERREFFAGLARACLLSGLGWTGGLLAWRRWKAGACTDLRLCRACPVHTACPAALRRPRGKP